MTHALVCDGVVVFIDGVDDDEEASRALLLETVEVLVVDDDDGPDETMGTEPDNCRRTNRRRATAEEGSVSPPVSTGLLSADDVAFLKLDDEEEEPTDCWTVNAADLEFDVVGDAMAALYALRAI